jgi:very-short-patch-repair endonuclease
MSKKIEKSCLFCGKIFRVYKYVISVGFGKFCSLLCYHSHCKNTKKRCKKVDRFCLRCGKKFSVKPCFIKLGHGKYCSRSCSGKANGFVNRWKKKVERIERSCTTCGKIFYVTPYTIKKGWGKYCSISCSTIWKHRYNYNKRTKIELKLEDVLKRYGIKYEAQKVIPEGRTVADFYIPEQRLVIYADGTYWHKSKRANERGVPKRDATQDLLLGLHGYNVFRFSEEDINKSPESCIDRVVNKMN